MSKQAVMEVFSDFQAYIDEDQDIREVFLLFIIVVNDVN